MKNKFFAMLLALGVICTTPLSGCEKKKTAETVSDDAVPEEITMREVRISDAEVINVPVQINRDGDCPVQLSNFTIPELEMRKSECGKSNYTITYYDENDNPVEEYVYSDGTPEIIGFDRCDNIIYLAVDYDNCCQSSHNWAIFSFDTETEEISEIYSYSDKDEGRSLSAVHCTSKNIYIECGINKRYHYLEEDTPVRQIISVEPETGDSNVIWESEDAEPVTGGKLMEIYEDTPYLIYITDSDYNNPSFSYNIEKLNNETGKFEMTAENERYTLMDFSEKVFMNDELSNILITPDAVIKSRYNASTGSNVITDDVHYSIDTEEKQTDGNVNIIGGDENSVIWTQRTVSGVGINSIMELNKYDLNTNTLYKADVSSLGPYSTYYFSDGNIYISSDSLIYYLIPELGMSFVLTPIGRYQNCSIENGTLKFMGSEGMGIDSVQSDSMLYFCQ
ncbi:MAG: hypothetical protein MR434_07080 [Ruminococcus sp.]|nr:hypothetical protein [Ruminococcus sp.]